MNIKMKEDFEKPISKLPELGKLPANHFENIFNVYTEDKFFAFNIIKNINIPTNLDDNVFYYYRIPGKIAWTTLSHRIYGTIKLWWLICAANKIINPVFLPEPGSVIRVIRPDHVQSIISVMAQDN